jgi:hypothetical protein
MKPPQTALLLVGSPKPGESTSESLGAYLFEALEKSGITTQKLHVTKAVRSDESREALLAASASADLIVLSFPLYVDCLPGPAIRALELIAAARAGAPGDAPAGEDAPAFLAICQSGFAEADHSAVAIEICRNFAGSAGFAWAGGLVMSEGGMISGAPMSKVAGRMPRVVKALDLTAAALAEGRPAPDEAVELMAKPAFPPIAYRLMANMGWRSMLKKQGKGEPIDARPFG